MVTSPGSKTLLLAILLSLATASAAGQFYPCSPHCYFKFSVERIPGGTIRGAPSEYLEFDDQSWIIFVRGLDDELWAHRFKAGENVSEWIRFGGALTSNPTTSEVYAPRSPGGRIFTCPDGRRQEFVDVYGLRQDGSLWRTRFDSCTWSISDWQDMGGQHRSSPAVLGRLIFTRGMDDAVWTRDIHDPGARWYSLGGETTTMPAVVTRYMRTGTSDEPSLDFHALLIARGSDGRLRLREKSGDNAHVYLDPSDRAPLTYRPDEHWNSWHTEAPLDSLSIRSWAGACHVHPAGAGPAYVVAVDDVGSLRYLYWGSGHERGDSRLRWSSWATVNRAVSYGGGIDDFAVHCHQGHGERGSRMTLTFRSAIDDSLSVVHGDLENSQIHE